MTRGLTFLFAVVGGMAVGNLYWAQPLLGLIAVDLRVSTSRRSHCMAGPAVWAVGRRGPLAMAGTAHRVHTLTHPVANEDLVGRALAPVRDQVVIATKISSTLISEPRPRTAWCPAA